MLSTQEFTKIVYDYYADNKRNFIWRDTQNSYWVVVSELMLQQTQTFRVEQKFENFVRILPTFNVLAQAPFVQVLSLWKGLGYNRRALYVHQIAQKIVGAYAGVVPEEPFLLENFPGIGPATARSIVVFAYNKPEVFIETNIRAVFLHHFFPGVCEVDDKELLPLVEKTLDNANSI